MKEIQIIPLQSALGVEIGWSREQTIEMLGVPESTLNKTDYYQKELPMFSISYDSEIRIEYIEISNPKKTDVKVLFQGYDVFGIPANELINQIETSTSLRYDRNDPELPYSFIFLEVELSFWRPVLQEYIEDPEGMYFETIGIGKEGYYTK